MVRFVFSIGIVVQIAASGAVHGSGPAKAAPEGPRLTKEDWSRALSEVQVGIRLNRCDEIVASVLQSGFVETESWSRGVQGRSFRLRYYTLDEHWRLVVHYDYVYHKVVRFWITGLEDLRSEIDTSVFSLVEAVHRAPDIRGLHFDPARLVRSVNALHAAGFARSLRALREYDFGT